MNVFIGQTLLTICLDTGYDLTPASEVKILYVKPSGEKGDFTAAVSDTTKILYNVEAGDIDVSGVWTLQAYAEIGGKIGLGTKTSLRVKRSIL